MGEVQGCLAASHFLTKCVCVPDLTKIIYDCLLMTQNMPLFKPCLFLGNQSQVRHYLVKSWNQPFLLELNSDVRSKGTDLLQICASPRVVTLQRFLLQA